MKSAAELFWPKVDVGWTHDCWEWKASTLSNGYGQFSAGRIRGMSVLAHRISYSMIKGDPGELQIDHLCHNKKCVNPAHLEAVTAQENTQRAHDDGLISDYRNGNSAKTHCKNGHPFHGENLVISYKGDRICRACRNKYSRERQAAIRAHASS